MAGTYQEGQSKVLSGVYSRIVAALSAVTGTTRGVVSYPFTADWGPINELTPVTRQPSFEKLYNGSNTNFTASKVNTHAFKGNPAKVLAYRMAVAGTATKGEATLMDDQATPQESLVLETLYPSDRAFTAAVSDAIGGGKKVDITESGVLMATVEGSDLETLESELNKTPYVRVKSKGTQLPANTAGVEFTGGNNGDAVTATEYDAYRTELEADATANAFALDTYDAAEIDTTETYVDRVRSEGFYVTFVSGGPASWDSDTDSANTESKNFNHRGILNVGNGVGDYTAADLAIFIAARAASVALNSSLTDEAVPYDYVNVKLTKAQRKAAKQAGTIVFVQSGDQIEIDEAVNTLTTPGENQTKEFGKIRVSNTIDYILSSLESFGEEYKKGRSNTSEARETYAATVEQEFFVGLSERDVIADDFYYRPDPEYHGDDATQPAAIDEAFFHFDVQPIDSMEKVYQKAGISFN